MDKLIANQYLLLKFMKSISVFNSGGQITQQPTVLIGKVVAILSLLCHDELDNKCYNA
jgi:hypothetical protein